MNDRPSSGIAPPRKAAWRTELAAAVRDPDELCDLLGLPDALRGPARRAAEDFGLLVPRPFLSRMRPGDPADPLLAQVLPLAAELDPAPGYTADPVGELHRLGESGLVRKYRGRALLVATGACAVHCRYCFRRHFPYAELPKAEWAAAVAEFAADPTLREAILSGGDPLTRSDAELADLARRLAAIPHLTRLRLHSRLPIVLPSRVTDELLDWLAGTRLAPLMVVHANHPNELDADTLAALRRLVRAGVPTLNQAVLLRGVNDDADTLAELCERLADHGVQPYYLHLLDPVAGAAHFAVPERTGRDLVAALAARLPGHAVPRLVREEPGAPGKAFLA